MYIAGVYGLLVPYFNGIFSGKVARFDILKMDNVQEVDLMVDRAAPDILKGSVFSSQLVDILPQNSWHSVCLFLVGFRGGFVNNWQGTPDDIDDVRRRRLARSTISVEQRN
jgi:hypothetical protein